MTSRTIVPKLMVPIAIMLLLIMTLGAVALMGRAALRDAYQELQAAQ